MNEPDIACVRNEAELAQFPAQERNAWEALWAFMRGARAEAEPESGDEEEVGLALASGARSPWAGGHGRYASGRDPR